MTLNIGFVAITRFTFDTALAEALIAQARAHLTGAGLTLVGPADPIGEAAEGTAAAQSLREAELDLLVVLQATFADATVLQALVEGVDAPLLLWALPEEPTGGRLRLNSLCGVNLGAFALRQGGRKPQYLYAPVDDAQVVPRIETLARAGRAGRLLAQARVGVIGDHPDGFGPCRYDAAGLRGLLGATVVPLDLADFFTQVQAQSPATAHQTELAQQLPNLAELDQPAVDGTLKTYAALNTLTKTEALNGVALRCWPEFFTKLGCAACGALSLLTDRGIPSSCEADVNGTITQLLLQAISGEATFITDLVSADPADDSMVFWHCGLAPLSMADPAVEPRGTIHSNRKLPLLMEFPLKPGRVTIARLSESQGQGYRLVVGRGEMLARPNSFSGTSGVCRLDSPVEAVLAVIMQEGLEHHYSITYGDHYDSLLAFAELRGLPVVPLTQ